MGMTEKLGAVFLTAGTSGALIAQSNNAQAAGAIAGGAAAGLIPAASVMVVDRVPATSAQIARVEGRARQVLAAMPSERRQQLLDQEIKYLAVEAPKPSSNTRGESAVMVFDIEKNRVAERTVFDVRVAPKPGSTMKLDSYITEYVGDGEDTSFLDGSPQTIAE